MWTWVGAEGGQPELSKRQRHLSHMESGKERAGTPGSGTRRVKAWTLDCPGPAGRQPMIQKG